MQLLELCELIVDCEHKTAPTQEDGFPSIRTPNIGRGHFILEGVNRVSEETYRLWTRRAVPQPGDLIMAREAPVGNVAMVPEGLRPCLGQRTLLLRPDRAKVEPSFLNYFLNGPYVQGLIQAKTNGATVAHLNMKDVRTMDFPELPSLPVQRRIAGILSAYDELMQNNWRRIRLLEAMARALYREWFVRPCQSGNLPKGWEEKKIGDVIELAYGKALKAEDRQGGDVPVFGSSGVVGYHHESCAKGPGIVVGRKGNVGSVFWSDADFWPIDTAFFVVTKLSLPYVYYNLQHQTFINNDAAVPGLSRNAAYMKPFIVPDRATMATFEKHVLPLFGQLRTLNAKNANLRRTRDLLLPRLLSGQVDLDPNQSKE